MSKSLKMYTVDTAKGTLTDLNASDSLANGYDNLLPLSVNGNQYLLAYKKQEGTFDLYTLTENAPYVNLLKSNSIELNAKSWDILKTFVLGNRNYVMAYEKANGFFGFYELGDDMSLSKNPYLFFNKRDWKTQNFTMVEPMVSLGLMYIICYDSEMGTVAAFSLDVIAQSLNGTPPLNMLNVWYHHWAKSWENFVFFQFGQSNFFFKINKGKLNVNIDHMQDNPAQGSVEIGSWLQNKLPNAIDVSLATKVDWENSHPHFLTYNPKLQTAGLYRVHADCQGWTKLDEVSEAQASILCSYQIDKTAYVLFYN
jgi:hypothetical protein